MSKVTDIIADVHHLFGHEVGVSDWILINQQKINDRRDLVVFDHALLTWAMSQLGKGKITTELTEGLELWLLPSSYG